MTDALLPRIAAGDTDAVEPFVRRYERVVWWMARQYAFRDPEDAVQDVFLALWQAAPKYDPSRAKESTFVGLLARRKLIDRYRKTTRRPVTQELATAPESALRQEASIEEVAEAALAGRLMRRELRPEQRSVIELSMLEGLSHREIGDVIGISENNVAVRLTRARAALARALGPPGDRS
jgi:RNA polymerase sigma-70 factor (ECF subfamily)